MVPAEETVEALIEGLVSPFLPRRGISRDNPSTEQQEAVAKHVCTVNKFLLHAILFYFLNLFGMNSATNVFNICEMIKCVHIHSSSFFFFLNFIAFLARLS